MNAKEFEKTCQYRMESEERAGNATMSRYGVHAVFIERPNTATGMMEKAWQPIHSLPDFEGILPPDGRQFIFDCKVCSAASFPLDEDKFKKRQLKHLLIRSEFGAITFLLLHFNRRSLKTKKVPERTVAFPVVEGHTFWDSFDRGIVKRIQHEDCDEFAIEVEWNAGLTGRTDRPDVLRAIHELAGMELPVAEMAGEQKAPF